MRFDPTTPGFQRVKAVYALDRSTTVIGDMGKYPSPLKRVIYLGRLTRTEGTLSSENLTEMGGLNQTKSWPVLSGMFCIHQTLLSWITVQRCVHTGW
jgi:hypothetical protein